MKLNRCLSAMRSSDQYHYRSKYLLYIRLLLTGVIVSFLVACGSVTDPQDTNNSETVEMTIAGALYFDERIPDGFYKEELPDDVFYTTSHVKNVSLLPVIDRAGLADYELSSDDYVEALAWSDKAAEYQQSYKQLTDIVDTELYYQFTRFDPDLPQFINRHRVFKASVLDRSGVDRSDEDSAYKGKITMPDLTAEKVKLIIEYLWMFTLSNNYRNAVLESYVTEIDDEFIHIMKQAKLDFAYSESCDSITVYDIRYTVSKSTGFIWKEKVLTAEFSAKRSGTYLEICD